MEVDGGERFNRGQLDSEIWWGIKLIFKNKNKIFKTNKIVTHILLNLLSQSFLVVDQ